MRRSGPLSVLAVAIAACHPNQSTVLEQSTQRDAILNHEAYLFVKSTPLRLAPSTSEWVPQPRAPEQVLSNFIGLISRGRIATIKNARPFWSEVVIEDGAEGWVPTENMVPARAVQAATVLSTARALRAPNLDADIVGLVKRGDLLFVRERGAAFSQIYADPYGQAYIDTKALVDNDAEVAVSHLLLHAK